MAFSVKTKDLRVDKIAKKDGYIDYEIFYSPISISIGFSFYLFIMAIPVLLTFLAYWYYFIAYLCIGYLLSSYLNNSFVLTENELLIINPNFPFKQFKKIKIDEIENVVIDSNRGISFLAIFTMSAGNYIRISSLEKSSTYYCISLDIECYDENFTEKTLDDFSHSLSQKGIPVDFNII